MKPPPFEYHRPESRNEALTLLQSLDNAKVLAGGQSLMPMMNFRYVLPDHVIDLNRCDDLSGVSIEGPDLVIGSMTRQRELERNKLVREHLPLLIDALYWVGHIQTRNRGTLGGSLAHLDPAAELPAALLAYDAVLTVEGKGGRRDVPLAEWSVGYMMPNLGPDELLVSVRVPLRQAGDHAHSFYEVARRHGDFAQAGAAVVFNRVEDRNSDSRLTDVRIALTGLDVAPRRLPKAEKLLSEEPLSDACINTAAAFASELPGIDDVHADATYRQRIAMVVTRRAIEQALAS